MNWKRYIQILYSLVILAFFYILKFPLYFIVLMGIIFFLVIFLKGKLYRKLENFLSKKFPSLSKLKPMTKKLIIILIFILIWIIIKQIIFAILKWLGIDFSETMIDTLNKSMQ